MTLHPKNTLIAASTLFIASSAFAATWDGGGDGASWQDGFNWSADTVPAGADDAFVNTVTPTTVTYNTDTSFTTSGMLQLGVGAGTSATFNLSAGSGTLQFGGNSFSTAARIGAGGGSATLNVSGGKLQIGTGIAGDDASMNLAGHNSGGTNTVALNISAGEVQIGRRILMGANGATQTASLTLSGTGVLNMIATGSNAEGDLGMIRLGNATNTLNFDGGEFTGRGIRQDAATASSAIYYNGTTFKLNGNSGTGATALIGSGGAAVNQIKNGGVTINTNGFDGTIARGLADFSGHSGALTKNGTGTLTLAAGGMSYTGGTIVNQGTLRFGANDTFGDASSGGRALTANSGAVVTNGGVFNTLSALTLNNATLTATGGAAASYQAFKLSGTVNATGTSIINANITTNTNNQIHLGHNTAGSQTSFNVAGVTDSLTVSATLRNGVTGQLGTVVSAGLIKDGAGTMTLSGTNTYTGDTFVNSGTLQLANAGALQFLIGASGFNNGITGSGTLLLDGTFSFDLIGASNNAGDSWQIVDNASLNETYGSNFNVAGFTNNGNDTWSQGDYLFSEANGTLSVVPEPGATLLGSLGVLSLLRRRRA